MDRDHRSDDGGNVYSGADRPRPVTRLTTIPNVVVHVGDAIVPDTDERGTVVEFRLFDRQRRHYATIVGHADLDAQAAVISEIQWLEDASPPAPPSGLDDYSAADRGAALRDPEAPRG